MMVGNETSRSGRPLKRPRQVYEPPSDFEDDDASGAESGDDNDEEEDEEDEDTDLSGFIAADDDCDESYVPSQEDEDEDDDTDDDAESDPMVVTRDNLIDKLMEFSEKMQLDPDIDEAEVLAAMVVDGYKFPFLKESLQLKLYRFYKTRTPPPLDLVREVFRL